MRETARFSVHFAQKVSARFGNFGKGKSIAFLSEKQYNYSVIKD